MLAVRVPKPEPIGHPYSTTGAPDLVVAYDCLLGVLQCGPGLPVACEPLAQTVAKKPEQNVACPCCCCCRSDPLTRTTFGVVSSRSPFAQPTDSPRAFYFLLGLVLLLLTP
jgi:hypothetical protein